MSSKFIYCICIHAYLTSDDNELVYVYALGIVKDMHDRLHEIGTVKHKQLFGSPMLKTESNFYMPLVRDPNFENQNISRAEENVDDVRLVYASPGMYGRRDSQKGVIVTPMSNVIRGSVESMSNFVYTDQQFSRAEELINNSAFSKTMANTFHEDYVTYIKNGLKRASGKRSSNLETEKLFNKTKAKFGAAVLMGNPEIAIQQTFSMPLFQTYIDLEYLTAAASAIASDKKRVDATLNLWSSLYYTRGKDLGNISLNEMMEAAHAKGYRRGTKSFDKVQGGMMRLTDKGTVSLGLYAGILQFQTEVRNNHFSDIVRDAMDVDDSMIASMTPEVVNQYATRFGEYAVERTQPMASALFTSELQTGTTLGRAFTMFGTFTNTVKNLMDRTALALKRGDPGSLRALRTTMIHTFLTMPILMSVFRLGRNGINDWISDKDEDDIDPMFETLAKSYVLSVSGYWFGVRDLSRLIFTAEDEITMTVPIYEIGNSSYKTVNMLAKSLNNRYTEEEKAQYLMNGINEGVATALMAAGKAIYINNKFRLYLKRGDK